MATATNEPFVPNGTTGQLQVKGSSVTAGAFVSSLVRTNWQGIITLSTSSRTNTEAWSCDLTNAAWMKGNVTAVPGFLDPKGGRTLVRLYETAISAYHYLTQFKVNILNATQYYLSMYVEKSSSRRFSIEMGSGASFPAVWSEFNPTTGVMVDTGAGTTTTVWDCGSFWKIRIKLPVSIATNADGFVIDISSDANATFVYMGDTTKYIGIWGVMMSTDPSVADIPTAGSPTSVIDFSYTDNGVVTLGQISPEATYTWTGTGTTQPFIVSEGIYPSGGDFTMMVPTTAIVTNQQLAQGDFRINYSGSGHLLNNPALMQDNPFLFITPGQISSYNTTQMFMLF